MFKKLWEELKKDKFLMALLGSFLGFLVLYLASYGLVNTVLSQKAVLGLKINNIEVGAKSKEEITKILTEKVEKYKKEKIVILVGANEYSATVGDFEPEYKIEEAADRAVNYGKDSFDPRVFAGGHINISPSLKKETFDKFYAEISKREGTPAVNAQINFSNNELTFTQEKDGEGVSEETLKNDLATAFAEFATKKELKREILKPTITKEMLEVNKEDIQTFLNKNLVLKAGKLEDKVSKESLSKWLGFKSENGTFKFVLNEVAITDYLKILASKVATNPANASLGVKDGKVIATTPSQDGKKLDIEKSTKLVAERSLTEETVELIVVVQKAEVNETNLEALGLRELVSSGTSDFTGSPVNRKHNVKTGAFKFNGILLKPNETFSFNKYLGEVDAANGYLPELVILQNKTEPQFGGGLCQVSSTAFRAALNAGMPIVSRVNHAYPVKYYYPIGADATIYLPNPDFKFKNDTGGYVLIQTSITGNILKFDFYGTKLARTVKFSGSQDAAGAVDTVEKVTPFIFNQDLKGKGSLDSVFYRFTYDANGKLIDTYKNLSKYDSPDKYPKPAPTP